MASTVPAIVTATEQEAPKTTMNKLAKEESQQADKRGKATKKQAAKKAASKNGLSEAERKRDMAEAASQAKQLRKKYQPSFKVVAPGIRTNAASGRFEVLVTKYVGAFDSLAKAQKARQAFIDKVAKIRL